MLRIFATIVAVSLLPTTAALSAAGIPKDGESRPEAKAGPVVPRFGAVYAVDEPDFPVDRVYKVVFDVKKAPEDPAAIDRGIETLARFLNMHAQSGVPAENMKLALVLHSTSGRAALSDDAYRARHGVANPNLPLLEDLRKAGVEIYLCGQTAAYRGFAKDELAEPVELALSAMTFLVTLQADGYQLIAF